MRKENLRPKYLKRKGIKDTCSLADTKNKQKEHIYIPTVEQNYCSEHNNEMSVLYLNSESCVIRPVFAIKLLMVYSECNINANILFTKET